MPGQGVGQEVEEEEVEEDGGGETTDEWTSDECLLDGNEQAAVGSSADVVRLRRMSVGSALSAGDGRHTISGSGDIRRPALSGLLSREQRCKCLLYKTHRKI